MSKKKRNRGTNTPVTPVQSTPQPKKNIIEVVYDDKTLETLISVNGKAFDTSRINGKEIADWAYPFMMRKVRWNGFYDEMVQALGGQKAFDLVFEGSDEALAELREAWENAPVNVVSGSSTENAVVIVYDENTLTTEITVNGQPFDTSRINGKEIADWVYPFMMRKVKWDGIFEELAKVVGSQEYTIKFSGSNAAMNELMEECPETVSIKFEKQNKDLSDTTTQSNDSQKKRVLDAAEKFAFDSVEKMMSGSDDIDYSMLENLSESDKDYLLELASNGEPAAEFFVITGNSENEEELFNAMEELAKKRFLPAEFTFLFLALDDKTYGEDYLQIAEYIKDIEASSLRDCLSDGMKDIEDIAHELDDRQRLEESFAIRQSVIGYNYNVSISNLGWHYHYGKGVEKNLEQAVRYYKKAIAVGDTWSKDKLKELCIDPDTPFYDPELSDDMKAILDFFNNEEYAIADQNELDDVIDKLSKHAKQGNPTAQFTLGKCYLEGIGVEESLQKARVWISKAAENGHPTALSAMAEAYHYGEDIQADDRKAFQYIRKAVDCGADPDDMDLLAAFYTYGWGTPVNVSQGLECRKVAAEFGSANAQLMMGLSYEEGDGVQKDESKAFEYYKLAADQYDKNGLNKVATCYAFGIGVQQDLKQAAYYAESAMDHGSVSGACLLADMYMNGEGVQKDTAYGLSLYKQAHEIDPEDGSPLYSLGICFYFGLGVAKNEAQGMDYITQAANLDDENALEFLQEIENEKDAIRRYEQRNGAVDDLLDLAGLIPGVSEFTSAIKIGKKTGEKIAGGFFKFFGN